MTRTPDSKKSYNSSDDSRTNSTGYNPLKFFFAGKEYHCGKTTYYPSDDSYLLAECVKIGKGENVIDMGCGAGLQSLNALFLGAARVIAADINGEALSVTLQNCRNSGLKGRVICRKSDLFSAIPEKAGVIIFNPPYVASGKIRFTDLDGGGRMGREVLGRFLAQMPSHLREGGRCFFLQTDFNGYKKTEQALREQGMEFSVLARKRGFFEEIAVYECRKISR
ncbi:MAG TPA: methyltransferase [Candidatus Diapherotrites archaeon]|uniref:Methyltransferase n=1 Tax=Candidatus Iainarchaeum sp. TaxID=3101447 RepID=A0A7J4IUU3_9ARCH|nr:methyltransferase [Candidatus Diapherotrites archaeon]